MATCSSCGATVVFGGKKELGFRFCSKQCLESGRHLLVASQIPQSFIDAYAEHIHTGQCPRCEGEGPVDVHKAYKVWSIVYFFNPTTESIVACKRCAVKSQMGAFFYSFFLGWWGLGALVTPLQLSRNIWHMVVGPHPGQPSPRLKELLRMDLAGSE